MHTHTHTCVQAEMEAKRAELADFKQRGEAERVSYQKLLKTQVRPEQSE